MRDRSVRLLAVALLVAGGSSCVSLKRTAEARFFVLRPLVGPSTAAPPSPAYLVGVRPVAIPGYIDRPQIVTWTGPGELRIDEFVRWGEPLDEGVTRTLVEDLLALLPEAQVIREPYPESVKPCCRVSVTLSAFGPQTGGLVRLDARWALLPPHDERPFVTRTVSLDRGPFAGAGGAAPDTGVAVEAMSALVGELARQIAPAIREQAAAGASRTP
jgi:uncharacterized lipoprotein YmbA